MIRIMLMVALLTGCAAPQIECLTVRTVGISVVSTDPRIPAATVTPTTTTVCITPASVERGAKAN